MADSTSDAPPPPSGHDDGTPKDLGVPPSSPSAPVSISGPPSGPVQPVGDGDPLLSTPLPPMFSAAPVPRRKGSRYWGSLAAALVGLAAIVAICAMLIEAAPHGPALAASIPLADGAGSVAPAEPTSSDSPPEDASAAAAVDSADSAAGDAAEDLSGAAPPTPPPPRKYHFVSDVAARSCSTEGVRGLSLQIIAEARCIRKDAFAPIPRLPNLKASPHVYLFLETPARDHLVRALKANPKKTMTLNSALRTIAQQYILDRWYRTKRCGIQLASDPGTSNHETGLALDVHEFGSWRSALEHEGFKWMGKIDRVHFDYRGAGAADQRGLDVLAFKRLWNRNHPDDKMPETDAYDEGVAKRVSKSPAGGFPSGPRCGSH